MLETNLMKRFVSSEGFKAAARLSVTSPANDYPTPDEETSGRFHEHLLPPRAAGTAAAGGDKKSATGGSLETTEEMQHDATSWASLN